MSSALIVLGWCAAVWAHHLTPGASPAVTGVFGILGFAYALLLLFGALADARERRSLAFFVAVIAGPTLGWLVGSNAVLALGAGDAVARLALRVVVAMVIPGVALAALFAGSPGKVRVLAVAVYGFAALSAVTSLRDVTHGVERRDVVVAGVNFEHGDWFAYFDGVGVEIGPNRHDVQQGSRGRATYLAASKLLLDWRGESRPGAIRASKSIAGDGLGAVALVAAEALLCAALLAARVRRIAALALLLPLVIFPQFFLLTAFGRSVDATVIDKGMSATRGARAPRRWSYTYAIRARTADGRAVADVTDEDGYRAVAIDDRVRFVVGPANSCALGDPRVGVGGLVVFAVAAAVTIVLARRRPESV